MAHAKALQPTSQSARIDSKLRPIDFTVAICTYNGEHRLPEVLDRLKAQVSIEGLRWEVIIIDNNSQDNTAQVVRDYQSVWPTAYPIRYYFERKQGAAFARNLALQSARSQLVGFLDDDNLPAANWIATAYAFGEDHPTVGAYGSQIHGQFESPPPENFHRIESFFAITQRGPEPHQYEPRLKVLPPSAGLVVRRSVWLENVPEKCLLTGRFDSFMLTGEDLEALSYIQLTDWEIWHNPAMQVHHKIPSWRLDSQYLMPFFSGVGLGRHVTRMLSVKPWQRPFIFPIYMANDIRKLVCHGIRYGAACKTDLVARCEMQFFLCSLASPFYIWGKIWRKDRLEKPHSASQL